MERFVPLSGEGAFQLSRKMGKKDKTYGGYGGNWQAMLAVLTAKFQPGSARTLFVSCDAPCGCC